MSQKSAKAERKALEAKQQESKERQEKFMKEVQALSEKYRVDMIAGLQYKQTAIVPLIVLVDVKDKYEAMTAEAKRVEAEKLKNQAANGEVKKENSVPKLEV